MRVKFPYAELVTIASRLPEANNAVIPESDLSALVSEDALSAQSRRYLEAYKPIMDSHVDLSGVPKEFRASYKIAIACGLNQVLRTTTHREATLAGVALPAFAKQKLMMVMRAYPKLMAPQLFGFIPMKGPSAVIGYTVMTYGDPYTASSPVIAAGDEINDSTKANKGFTQVAEADQARKTSMRIAKQTITATTHRVITEYSQDLVEDAMSQWEIDAPSALVEANSRVMAQTIDVTLLDAASADAPSGNAVTFDATPASGPDYSSLTPDQQRAYDEFLIKNGVVPVVSKIASSSEFEDNSWPDWAICSPLAGRNLEGVRGFTAVQNAPDSFGLNTGPIRYIGNLNTIGGGIRVMVSKFYNRGESATAKILFGKLPQGPNDPGIRLGMFVPLEFTPSLYDPNTDTTTRGVRSRFAVARKDGGVADSAQLVRVYGELSITQ